MVIKPIKTRRLLPPKDDLRAVIRASLKRLPEKSIFVVTSKVVAIAQGRCLPIISRKKDELIIEEADAYLSRDFVPGGYVMHTLKENIFIPSSGIDESNANGYYILWPKDSNGVAADIQRWLRKTYKVKECGVLITDSHTIPLRRGVVGISLGSFGFEPLHDYRHEPDLFGRTFKFSQANYVDSLAAAAVVVMGEGSECTPLALITDVSFLRFTNKPFRPRDKTKTLDIPLEEDLYGPFLANAPWKKGGRGKK